VVVVGEAADLAVVEPVVVGRLGLRPGKPGILDIILLEKTLNFTIAGVGVKSSLQSKK
jgi:hypothetical protein